MDQLRGIQSDSSLSLLFFSEKNVQNVQDQIRYNVWLKSEKKNIIGLQDHDQLLIVMRSIFLQEALNQPTNIGTQILALNKSVLDFAVTQVFVELKQHVSYLDNLDSGRQIMEHSVNPSKRGDKQLVLKPW
jgi:hypothetical protein